MPRLITDPTVVEAAGNLRLHHEGRVLVAGAGGALVAEPGERVRYDTLDGAEYLAICVPAFSPDTVHRDD